MELKSIERERQFWVVAMIIGCLVAVLIAEVVAGTLGIWVVVKCRHCLLRSLLRVY